MLHSFYPVPDFSELAKFTNHGLNGLGYRAG